MPYASIPSYKCIISLCLVDLSTTSYVIGKLPYDCEQIKYVDFNTDLKILKLIKSDRRTAPTVNKRLL